MKFRFLPAVMLACGLLPAPAQAEFSQQAKLVGTGATGFLFQGWSVSVSGDGSTAIVGGAGAGAAWVYTRSGAVWTQQAKLVGTGVIGVGGQGYSVSLSNDGNTAIVGGDEDNSFVGAAWVFTRSGGVWTQQAKLVGTGAIGQSYQGVSVSLSGDGNTAIVGGPIDNNVAGAAWMFTRSGGVWTQQAKLVGTGAMGIAEQGFAVALSGDGGTAIVGGVADNNLTGATWVYTRSGAVWTQQAKLVGTGNGEQGYSVSLSGDGNTAIIGGLGPGPWVYTRSAGVWNQQVELIGTGAVGDAAQGVSVSLSGDGNIAIVGGPFDDAAIGAAWVFTSAGGVWTQQAKLVGTGTIGSVAEQGWSVSLSKDGGTAIVGGPDDNNYTGAAWVFTQPVFAGIPRTANCFGQSVETLVQEFGGLNAAVATFGFSSISALQGAILAYCHGIDEVASTQP